MMPDSRKLSKREIFRKFKKIIEREKERFSNAHEEKRLKVLWQQFYAEEKLKVSF